MVDDDDDESMRPWDPGWALGHDVPLHTTHPASYKTREQRLAEEAAMDKSPLFTLTLEDFLESERHKLTGKLIPVTSETFAKWKKD